MIDLEFVEKLIQAIDASSLDSIEIERGGTRIHLSKTPAGSGVAPMMAAPVAMPQPQAAPAPAAASQPQPAASEPADVGSSPAAGNNWVDVTSPMVGTFYRAPSPESPSFVETGATVSPGDTLCIIEAMKLMNELEAEVSGTIREILVENGEPVEYGQVLFRVEPA
jgi:acetyl-CoA carboxylase biotin carboxyl carrier protein